MSPTNQRRIGLFQATVLNMIDMVGIGPFVMLPIVIGLTGGMYLYAWLAGALLSLIDACIWSELGAAYPLAGGSYHFLKHAYGEEGPGRMMSFLFVWQTIIQAPLVAASAAIGFAQYAAYLVPMESWQQKTLSGAVILLVTFLLYRKIDHIGKIGVFLWGGVLLTLGWIIFGGITHGHFLTPFHALRANVHWQFLLSFAFGQGLGKTIYSYLGYYNVCHIGGDIRQPSKNIPRSMFISIMGIACLYLAMNVSVTSVLPWQEIKSWTASGQGGFVISIYIQRLYGATAAKVVTVMILWVALASLFALMLGYSRVPYAAAADGSFFKIFARLHPVKQFPYVSLLTLAAVAFVFSVQIRMEQAISGILAMRIVVQFVGQAVGVVLLRKRKNRQQMLFRMPLYPLPIILAIVLWLFLFFTTGKWIMLSFCVVFLSGIIVYLIFARVRRFWPYHRRQTEKQPVGK